jgi:hypothetical protein
VRPRRARVGAIAASRRSPRADWRMVDHEGSESAGRLHWEATRVRVQLPSNCVAFCANAPSRASRYRMGCPVRHASPSRPGWCKPRARAVAVAKQRAGVAAGPSRRRGLGPARINARDWSRRCPGCGRSHR